MLNKDTLDNNSDSKNNENKNLKGNSDEIKKQLNDNVDQIDQNMHVNTEDNNTKSLDDLQKELDELNNKYELLMSEYNSIKNSYDLVNQKLKNLLSHYGKLEKNYDELKQNLKEHKNIQTNSSRVKLVEQIFSLHEKLLLILDNNQDSNDENILLLKMINHEIESIYLDWGVEKYSQNVGDIYDVNLSKIVSTISHDSEDMKNKISRIIYIGYKMNNKIIKMSEVEVLV